MEYRTSPFFFGRPSMLLVFVHKRKKNATKTQVKRKKNATGSRFYPTHGVI